MTATRLSPAPLDQKALKLLLKDCAEGFYQQMYFLGKDVTVKEGNQLLEYGFSKSSSKGLKGTSCYTLTETERIVELYGSCASCYTDTGNVAFLRTRRRFYHWLPEHRCVAGKWKPEEVALRTPESLFQVLSPLLQWWVEYETWIQHRFGTEYREQCYKEWRSIKTQKPCLPPEDAVQWVSSFLNDESNHIRPKNFLAQRSA